ncbi:MAG: hypothetical protein HY359_04800 [Candidatus Rokubacteria bacterium]|nr:hypothetical protein [Candidatus Rokubacteria bacterium]
MRLGILLAGHPTIVRQDLKALLEVEGFAVIGEASAAHDAIRLTRQLHPDVVVLESDVPPWTAIDVLTRRLARYLRVEFWSWW